MESNNDQIEVIDKLLRQRARAAGRPARAVECSGFDADLASAYFEKMLSPSEEQRYESHLGDCHNCRKMMAEYMLLFAEPQAESAAETTRENIGAPDITPVKKIEPA